MINLYLSANASIFLAGFLTTLGACVGSFAALVIWRLPQGLSIVVPRSFCSHCLKPLLWWQNIPIWSWLILRGKCAFCKKSIGLRPLVIELIFAVLLLALYVKFGLSIALLERFGLVFLLVCLAYIDLDTYSFPVSLLIALMILGLASSAYYFIYPHAYVAPSPTVFSMNFTLLQSYTLNNRWWGAVLGFLILTSINLIGTYGLRKSKRLTDEQWAMGFGDSFLAMAIGLFVGKSHILSVIFIASAFGTLGGLASRFLEKQKPAEPEIALGAIPFGPFLALAAIYIYLF